MRSITALTLLCLVACPPGWVLDETINKPLGWKLNDPPPRPRPFQDEKRVCYCAPDDAGGCPDASACNNPSCGWCSNGR